jgi:hypothetical protein
MNDKHADQLPFRAWLIKQLKVARWSTKDGESQADLALRLGVSIEVLLEAAEERTDELLQQGKLPRQLGTRALNASDYFALSVTMPPAVHADWTFFCGALRIQPSAMLRSLIHDFLITKLRPRTTGSTWLYKGTLHRIKPSQRLHAKTRITRGAQIALDHYAEVWNVKATGIVRGIITDCLRAGRLPPGLRIIAFGAMWGDPARYLER